MPTSPPFKGALLEGVQPPAVGLSHGPPFDEGRAHGEDYRVHPPSVPSLPLGP